MSLQGLIFNVFWYGFIAFPQLLIMTESRKINHPKGMFHRPVLKDGRELPEAFMKKTCVKYERGMSVWLSYIYHYLISFSGE